MKPISDQAADVLAHAIHTGRYVTDEPHVIALAQAGLLFDHGAQRLAGGMHYLTMTDAGHKAFREWKDSQMLPPKVKVKRRTPAFQAWRDYREAFQSISFSDFWRKVWPSYYHLHPGWTPERREN